MSKNDYPWLLYVYTRSGHHHGAKQINNDNELVAAMYGPVRQAMDEKREVILTDAADLQLFRAYNGCIKWNGSVHHECDNCREEKKAS